MKRALHTVQRFTPDTHDGVAASYPEENRDPSQGISFQNA